MNVELFFRASGAQWLKFTLERVYGVKTVLHLHGGVPSCSAIPPIMGHGNKFIIDYYKRRAQCASEEFVEWEESICSAIAKFCSSLYKDTDAIISLSLIHI